MKVRRSETDVLPLSHPTNYDDDDDDDDDDGWVKCLYSAVDSGTGGKGRKLEVLTTVPETTAPTAPHESIFDVMLSGPRPIISILVLWTDVARRHLASVLRRVLQEGFQVVGLRLHMTLTAVKNSLGSNVCIVALCSLFLQYIWVVTIC